MPRPSSSRGFTLIEVLVALTLVSLLVTGATALLVRASRLVQLARDQTTGTLLATQTVEALRSNPAGASPGQVTESIDRRGVRVPEGQAAYVRQWTVEEWTVAGVSSRLMVVRVQVSTATQRALASVVAVVPGSGDR